VRAWGGWGWGAVLGGGFGLSVRGSSWRE